METLLTEIRYGVRRLLKHPGFTAIAVVTLALGISANTTIFSAVDSLLLHPFSFANQDRLVVVFELNRAIGTVRGSVSPGNFVEWREHNQSYEELVAIEQRAFDLSDGSTPQRVPGYRITEGFFQALGVKAALGRTLLPEDSEPGREQVTVLKHSFWQQHFAGDPDIVGKTINLNRKQFTVVGVMPADFNYPYNTGEMWVPLVFTPEEKTNRGNHYLRVIGLLKPGVAMAQAQSDLSSIAQRAQLQFPETNSGRGVNTFTIIDDAVRGARSGVPIAMGAVVLVLLIACANVANLLLVRAASRKRETALRLALGASRSRVMVQALTESALLGLAGGALGLLISIWAIDALAHGMPEGFSRFIPGWSRLGINFTVLAFTFGVSMTAGLLAGLAPVWHSLRTNLNDALKAGGRGDSGAGHNRLKSVLIVSEVALTLVLLVGAGLLVRSFVEIQRADLGIQPENVLALQVSLPEDSYQEQNKRLTFYEQLLARVKASPGVIKAGAVSIVPFSSSDRSSTFRIVGRPPFPTGEEPDAQVRFTTPEYFEAIGTGLRSGRLYNAQDNSDSGRVVLINEEFAQRFFEGQDPIGQRLNFGGSEKQAQQIIGVVADVTDDDLDNEVKPTAYSPYAQNPSLTMNLIIRGSHDPAQLAAAVRSETQSLDPHVPVSNVKPLRQMIEERSSPKRVMAYLMGIFGLVALLLASVGIYGVMSYAVTQRTQEIGVRMALGAQALDVLKLVVRNGMTIALIGVAIGLGGAYALSRLLSSLLFKVSPTDLVTFAVVSISLIVVAFIASYLPARRATKVDPLVALRHE
ncbi:MAG TPA: ABC transporter permease [Pyrinomonadaceae bacterium]|nr:ABC transporter permease [Pyrinomonadaceae bacterium]